ncbi:hypothetical protein HHI36_003045 [Cryptolaemus montrouzieri]|uniref:tRNA-5-taurinomethyluridine 2-sulfurtransferase n=1 Tax=Cryptolaemus montrouzieri TaxID=559131 RepID=A0ABD2PCW8_9CUCU
MLQFRRVIVAISGGVDSAVAALLLKLKGFSVEAIFMKNWDIVDEKGYCSSEVDYGDAVDLCKLLNIKLHEVNFVKQYWNEVFCDLVKDYSEGLTPNPDILCNRNIKFNYLYDYVIHNLKADAIATGHYACTSFGSYLDKYNSNEAVRLLKAKDSKKDQVFFLSQVNQEALRRTMFPLGAYLKSEVKSIARQNGLEKFANKKESMGICFIGSRDFQDFIREYMENEPGDFIDVDDGKVVGQHEGIHQWTLGQRARISGLIEAYFISRKNVKENTILLARGTNHPFLYSSLFFTSKPHWITAKPKELQDEDILECDFKFQHSQDWVPCIVFECTQGLIVQLKNPKRALTPGQYAVFCKGNECLGSARITRTPLTKFSLDYLNMKLNKVPVQVYTEKEKKDHVCTLDNIKLIQ